MVVIDFFRVKRTHFLMADLLTREKRTFQAYKSRDILQFRQTYASLFFRISFSKRETKPAGEKRSAPYTTMPAEENIKK